MKYTTMYTSLYQGIIYEKNFIHNGGNPYKLKSRTTSYIYIEPHTLKDIYIHILYASTLQDDLNSEYYIDVKSWTRYQTLATIQGGIIFPPSDFNFL